MKKFMNHMKLPHIGKRPLSFVVAVVACVGLCGFAASDGSDEREPADSKVTVGTVSISPAPFRAEAEFSGFVSGVRETSVSAKVSGYVVQLLPEEGDMVRQGDVLAVLDGSELSAAREEALLTLSAMEKVFRDVVDYHGQKVDEAKSALDRAKRNGSSSDIDAAEESLESMKRLRDVEVSAARTDKVILEGRLSVAETSAGNTVVRAPFDGVILRRDASLGSFVSPGMPIYGVASVDALEISVSLPATVASGLEKGAEAFIGSERIQGYVFSVARSVGVSTRQSVARVRFSFVQDGFRSGDLVSVSFPTDTAREAILVPESAIMHAYDDPFVRLVSAEGVVVDRPVEIGAVHGAYREITSGISSGDRLIIEGQERVRNADSVNERHETR
jgi:RND family efflux transporter MFP subunit